MTPPFLPSPISSPHLSTSATSLAPRPEQPPDMSVMQPATSMLQPSQSMMQSASSVQHASSVMQPAPPMMQPAPPMMQPAPPMMEQPVDMEQSPSPPPPNDRPLFHPRVPPSLHTPSLQSLLEEVSLDKTLIAKVKEQLNNSSPAQDSPGREEHFLHQVGREERRRERGEERMLYASSTTLKENISAEINVIYSLVAH